MKTKPKRRTWRWVSRDDSPLRPLLDIWSDEARPRKPAEIFYGNSHISSHISVCTTEFEKLFGFAPERGECIRVEFSARVLGEK